MLTATPVENNLVDLYSLITVLKPGLLSTEADFKKSYVNAARPRAPKNPEQLRLLLSEVMVRNTRSTVDVRLPHRVAASVVAPPSLEEAKLYERVSTIVTMRYRAADSDKRSGIALEWLQRQVGSSPQALGRALGRALSGELWMGPEERRELESIEEMAAAMTQSAKGLQFEKMLAGRSGKMVVFTEFLPTLDYLSQICERNSVSYALFSGDLSHPQKDAAIARFRDEADVLLSTGSGGEGRNLQFANTMVNFDLPWNPMLIEQRVGRVYRMGKRRRYSSSISARPVPSRNSCCASCTTRSRCSS
jgi:SNF2 family DNA or RNA helicase